MERSTDNRYGHNHDESVKCGNSRRAISRENGSGECHQSKIANDIEQ